ncbi:MAG: RagB/SusD family nutrient uptake outer membrane protein [Gemmatimonadaceae bacterium]|nr:RagB/SusD family nutrient uptake outer membrane protein [Gemmatimonadaceae bacterium]
MTHSFAATLRHSVTAALAVVVLAGCNADKLNVPNFNAPATTTTPDIALVQNLASGILFQARANLPGFYSDAGIFGRESYNYFQTDGRSTSNYLAAAQLDNAGFAAGGWNGRYINIRNAKNFVKVTEAATFLTTAEKSAARGFANTFRAMEIFYLLSQRDSIGIPVEVDDSTNAPQPFVSRDSAYKYGIALINTAATELAAGGASFPFALTTGFAGLNTPANFLRFNRGVAARYLITYATLGGGTARFTEALTALNASFINSAAGADLRAGAFHVYSSAAGDALNGLSNPVSPDQVAHPSIVADAQSNAGVIDARVTAKTQTIPAKSPPGGASAGIPTTVGFRIYPSNVTPLPIIRNEELILLRAEANIGLGNLVTALTDINFIRVNSGGLLPLAPFANADAALTALLYEKRYSLLWEGSRWVDVRRYNRLNTLPLDVPGHFRIKVQPVPQAECLFRAPLDATLKGPGC